MYSGTTLTKMSGRLLGTHQKIDRIARKQLMRLVPELSGFPPIKRILHYEGKNGPDAIKRKSPARNEPWHFINPYDDKDMLLLEIIQEHYDRLVQEFKVGNQERIAFEAAWLSHAMVDGLTPAHHYPYEEELKDIRNHSELSDIDTLKKKFVMPGNTTRELLSNNWRAWGPRGLKTAHTLFEMGVATLIAPLQFGEVLVTEADIARLKKVGLQAWYRDTAREIAVLDMYHNYIDKGWTPKLAWQVRHRLGPTLVKSVALAWHAALTESEATK